MRRFALLFVVSGLLCGCGTPQQPEVSKPPEPRFAQLAAGSSVELVLLGTISSGDPEGKEVAVMVSEDVKGSAGEVVIPRGTVGQARIENSRSAGALSGLMNQPARLSISLPELKAVDGSTVVLRADEEGEPLHLTREMTAKYAPSNRIEKALTEEEAAKALRQLAEDLEQGKIPDLDNREGRALLDEVAEALELEDTSELLREDRVSDLERALESVRRGSALDLATGGTAGTALGAAYEIINVAEEVRDRVAGAFKGRNIRAYAGTPIEAQVAEEVRVRVKK